MSHSAENDAKRTLYSLILAGLIEWAGDTADIERERAALEAAVVVTIRGATRRTCQDARYVKDALLAVRLARVIPPAKPDERGQ